MATHKRASVVIARTIERAILVVRGERIVLDRTIASLYGVTVSQLNQAVRRNRRRFPPDFMFELTWEELAFLRSQIVILDGTPRVAPGKTPRSESRGIHTKYRPLAFTEQGVAMLSGVLRSDRAVLVNVEIMRAFVRLRRLLSSNHDLARRLNELEKRYDSKFKVVFDALRALMQPPPDAERRRIGFRTGRESEAGPSGAKQRRARDCVAR